MIDPMLDPFGAFLVEVRDDPDVADLIDDRTRGFEPGPGDAQGPKAYRPFMVLVAFGAPPHPRVPITFATVGARCYGVTAQNAWAVYGALVKAVHNIGPRLKASGLGIYNTLVISGGEEERDPDTKQPVVLATITLIATTQAVTV